MAKFLLKTISLSLELKSFNKCLEQPLELTLLPHMRVVFG